jgi:hypothetical protein
VPLNDAKPLKQATNSAAGETEPNVRSEQGVPGAVPADRRLCPESSGLFWVLTSARRHGQLRLVTG